MKEYFNEINGIKPIEVPDLPFEEHDYEPNELEGFQYVFTKNNMPTYHQMYDNFLHWNWNEYNNDKTRFESELYINSILDKIFTWINARLLGVINNGENHSELVEVLITMTGNIMNKGYAAVEFSTKRSKIRLCVMEDLAKKRESLLGRSTPFTKDDSIVWWHKAEKSYLQKLFSGIKQKPLIIPIINLSQYGEITLSDDFDQLYQMLFRYVIKYYTHVYGSKFQSTWVQIDRRDSIMAQELDPSSIKNINGQLVSDIEVDRGLFDTTRNIDGFQIKEGQSVPIYIASDDGDMWDHWMETYTMANIKRHKGKYYISSRRGFNLFHNNFGNITKEFVETLVAKGKDHEAVRTEMWKNVMESGAVLFPWDNLQQVLLEIRITNWDKYADVLNNILANGIHPKKRMIDEFIFDKEDMAFITVSDLSIMLEFWKVLEHTLDFWVKFEDQWSLVCNIQEKDMQFYIDNLHIKHTMWKDTYNDIDQLPDGKVLSIIPRDGMTWTIPGNNGQDDTRTYVNDLQLKKLYY